MSLTWPRPLGPGLGGASPSPSDRSELRFSQPLIAALRPVASRVLMHRLLDGLALGLIGGTAGASLLALVGRLLLQPGWVEFASLWLALAVVGALLSAFMRRPDLWSVARAADRLGLGERVSSALHAEALGAPVAPLLVRDAISAISRLDPSALPSRWPTRRWRPLAVGALCLVAAVLVPLPVLGDLQARQQRAEAIAAGRRSVDALRTDLFTSLPTNPVADRAAEELATTAAELARTESPVAADERLELAQEHLASLMDAEGHAWRHALDELAGAWSERPALDELARALRSQNPQALDQAVQRLADRAASLSPEEQRELALTLQASANDVRDVPDLSRSLREAAANLASAESTEAERAASLQQLSGALAEGTSRAATLNATQRAIAGLGQTRAALAQSTAQTGGSQAGSSMQTTTSSASATAGGGQSGSSSGQAGSNPGGGSNPPGATGSGGGAQTGSAGGSQAGTGSQPGPGTGGGASNGQGAGGAGSQATGGSAQTGGASGTGSGGSGAGGGAGAGGGPVSGHPGAANPIGTMGGSNRLPSNAPATTYDPVSVPSLMGGAEGPPVAVSGDAASGSGESVDLPQGPVSLGSVQPYDQVYAEYESSARQSVARQALPAGLQGVVQRYFTSIAPEGSSEGSTSIP